MDTLTALSDKVSDLTSADDTVDDLMSHPLVDQLKNKITYKVAQAVSDPKANAYVAEQKAKEANDSKKSKKTTKPSSPPQSTSSKASTLASKIFSRLTTILFSVILPILLASLVANESIAYPPAVRILFFLFTLIACVVSSLAFGAIGIFYLGKMAYHYYVNNMADPPPKTIRILPAFISLLPITTRTFPESNFKSFLTYPFRYPKTERDAQEVRDAMERYEESLGASFEYLEQVKSSPMFSKGLAAVKEWMKEAKEITVPIPPVVAPMPNVIPSAPSLPKTI